ncbi:ribosomal protection-like ABC-F family protein [Fructilactobacillus frigidiflavus]|uniref:ribosomal protection-like ABC-F family protein n=1 Tax=Fructilactobacillus frigidiflavus TaxID=3242688 RepID=UPI003756BF2B
MGEIKLSNVSYKYDNQDTPVFDKLNLILHDDWKLGIVGRNGKGKTTLLKLISGEIKGTGVVKCNANVQYFPYAVEENQTVLNIYQSLSQEPLWKFTKELQSIGIHKTIINRTFSTLSGGEKTKVLLAILFLDENSFKLIDEPTNHLDEFGSESMINYLNQKTGFIVVSHNSFLLRKICDHVLAFEKNTIRLHRGTYDSYAKQKNIEADLIADANKKIDTKIKSLKSVSNHNKRWSMKKEATKINKTGDPNKKAGDKGKIGKNAAKLMKKSKLADKKLEKEINKQKTLKHETYAIDDLVIKANDNPIRTLINFSAFSLGYSGELFNPISLTIENGDVVGIIGENGAGKTSLLNQILGNFGGKTYGNLSVNQKLKISTIFQSYHHDENINEYIEKEDVDRTIFLNNLHKLGVARNDFNKKISEMSLGQQKRIELARSLAQRADLYLWDEPLNYLDLYNQKQLLKLIKENEITMIIIDHNRDFLATVCNKEIELNI